MSMQANPSQVPSDEPSPGPTDGIPSIPLPEEECACIAHSVYGVRKDGSTGPIDIPQDPLDFTERQDTSNLPGSTAFSTLPNTSGLWDGHDLTIPVTGIYYTEVSFVRDVGANEDDVYLSIMRDPVVLGSKHSLGFAWAGQSAGLGNGSERQTGHFSTITMLEALDVLSIRAGADSGRHSHISNIRWNTFKLCCDPSIEVGYPC